MKHIIPVLLCLLLLGCADQTSPTLPETVPETTTAAITTGLYDPEHPVEKNYPGLVRAYPLSLQNVQGIRTLGNDVLVLFARGATTLTLFTGDNLTETASLILSFELQPDDPSLQVHEEGISFFDPQRQETILLDRQLQEIRCIAVPSEISGTPILSPNTKILYYCTQWNIIAWDLESGIRRTVKELSFDAQALTALHMDGQILECSIQDDGLTSKLLLSSSNGLEIRALPEEAVLSTKGAHYFAALTSGYQTLLVFGDADASAELLLPDQNWEEQFYLPEDHAAVTVSTCQDGTQLDYYELNTGILRSSLVLDTSHPPRSMVNSKGHSVYILAYDQEADCDILYRWDVLRQIPDPTNVTSYKTDYRNADNPDVDALEKCRQSAAAIGKKYGITVCIWEDATAIQPWDYQFTPEHLASVLEKELKLLDARLARYPEGFLEQTASHFTGLTICLVRQIQGTGDGQSLTSATGIQFFNENEAYVVITTGKHSEQALYHELYHVMETHILTESTALDTWEALNPSGFVYGGDETDIYLQGQTRAFVDRYSMRYAKEDRARVLENAMLQNKKEIFQSEYMQRKLTALCTGIREAYKLKKDPQILPWEQYLVNPIAPAA